MRALKVFLPFFALLALFAGEVHAALCDKPVRVRVPSDYVPFSYVDESGRLTGIDIEFMRDIFAEIGCEYELIEVPFKRAITELAEGRVDMMPFMSITFERQQFARFSAAYRNETAGLVMRKEDVSKTQIRSIEDIMDQGLVLGHELGAYRGEVFEEFLASDRSKPLVFIVGSTAEGIRMLTAGRIDALVEVPESSLLVAENLGLRDEIARHPFKLFSEPVHFMYSRKTASEDLINAINGAIQKLTESDDYEREFGSMALTDRPLDTLN